MSDDQPECCDHCRFWEQQPQIHDEEGQCHRYPPQLNPHAVAAAMEDDDMAKMGEFAAHESASQQITCWVLPLMSHDDWCGEFRPKPDVGGTKKKGD